MRSWLTSATLLLTGTFGASASAQTQSLGVVAERFHPAVTSGGYIITERPETAGPWRLGVGLLTSYSRSPLYIVAGPFKAPLIDHMLSASVMASIGLWRFGEVGLSLPVSLYQQGGGVSSPASVGDLALHLKGRLFTSRHFGAGLLGSLAFPTGDQNGFSGTGQVSFAPKVLLEGRARWLRAGLNAGVLLRQGGQAGDVELSHELTYSAGLGLRPHRMVELLGELYGSTALSAPFQERSQSPLEAGGAAALHLWQFDLTGGASAGLVGGYGAPAWRMFLSLRYQQPPRPEPSLAGQTRVLAAAPKTEVTTTVTKVAPPPEPRPVELAPAEPAAAEATTDFVGNAEVIVTATELIPKSPIFFDINRAEVREEFLPVLDSLALLLKEHPELGDIRIEGHTDATGRSKINNNLSLRRAKVVREALISRGVPAERILLAAFGPKRPLADNAAPEGRSQNRRVVFYHAAAEKKAAGRPGPL